MDLAMLLNKRRLVFDGGTGSSLVEKGLKPGEMPETWNLLKPEVIEGLHRAYIEAGADIIKTNTFGAYSFKLKEKQTETVPAALTNAKRAVAACGKDTLIALDVGPLGKLLYPFGDTTFDEAVGYFKELIALGKDGADLILIETMNDLYEIKAAVVAAKECSDLPIAVTVALDERGRLLTGADVETVVTFLEGIGVSALGVNCGFGPKAVKPFVQKMVSLSGVPVIANPNAGLPEQKDGRAVYSLTPELYAAEIGEILSLGTSLVGGCCGTTPAHIGAVSDAVKKEAATCEAPSPRTAFTSFRKTAAFGKDALAVGGNLDPLRNPDVVAYYQDGDIDSLVDECLVMAAEVDAIALSDAADVSSDGEFLSELVIALQEMTELPFVLTLSTPAALDRVMRIYNGKPIVIPTFSLEEALPAVARYGGAVGILIEGGFSPEAALDKVEKAKALAKTLGIKEADVIALTEDAAAAEAFQTKGYAVMLTKDIAGDKLSSENLAVTVTV